jgi:hypothetical protein
MLAGRAKTLQHGARVAGLQVDADEGEVALEPPKPPQMPDDPGPVPQGTPRLAPPAAREP